MTDKYERDRQYQYTANASMVVQRERTGPSSNLPSGESESLRGRKIAAFGDLVSKETDPELKKLKEKAEEKAKKKKDKRPKLDTLAEETGRDVINAEIHENLVYRPKQKETQIVYNQILNIVQRHIGDVPLDTLKAATDEVLAILKDDNAKDVERKMEIEGIIDKLDDHNFNQLTILAAKIIDYNPEDADNAMNREEVLEVDVDLEKEGQSSDSSDDEVRPYDIEDEEMKQKSGATRDQQDTQMDDTEEQKALQVGKETVFWIQNLLQGYVKNQSRARELFGILGVDRPDECEHKVNDLIKYYDTLNHISSLDITDAETSEKINRAKEELSEDIECRQIAEGLEGDPQQLSSVFKRILRKLKNKSDIQIMDQEGYDIIDEVEVGLDFKEGGHVTEENILKYTKNILDLDSLKFEAGGHLMVEHKWSLPKGSEKVEHKGYEEVYIPAVTHKLSSDEKLVSLEDLPSWTHGSFPKTNTHLNRIQSRVYEAAFKSSENLLICAPTGAGKTNIAMLTILHTMGLYQRKNGTFNTKGFKIIYIAPMKALVSEVVGNFSNRLSSYGIQVKELTGDAQLTKHQIEETQIIVTTPEKWDIVTRKAGDRAYVELVKLVIIDEIHLLHDSRGPVLESVVARTIRQIENTQEHVRIVGLSATLPNYTDVAAILRVKPNKGLFFFDNTFRPVPLEQIYIGITEKKAIKRLILSNEICYNKVIERAAKHPILIFVHSRKETVRTAKMIRDMALTKDELFKILRDDSATKEILKTESENCINNDVKDLLPFGIGVHHAGLPKQDRKSVEDLFARKHIQVLVSTATLAWGVNLPAHTVIIKGTQIYNPEKGKWTELSPQDILQMMGRAGRPQYDKTGEGIIITSHQELQYYLSLNNMQLPIESQFMSQLADQLNAEIVMGTVSNIRDAVNWLAYTYLYVRMLRSPELYGMKKEILDEDPLLIQRRTDLIHTAAILLDRAGLIKYDKRVGNFQSTPIGKVASHYYIKYESMGVYNKNLKPTMGMIDIFRLFSLSNEFANIPVRENEKMELNKFIEKVPIPVKGTIDEPATKLNILLQVYISRFKTEGYDLNADMVYVTQSAGRIMRALYEICLKKGWSQLTQLLLKCCKMVEIRMWSSMTPLRQFRGINEEILRKIEKKEQFTWEHFYNMTPQEIGEVVKFAKMGKTIHKLVHQFPRLELKAFVQPITRTCVKIGLEVIVDFQWNPQIHGFAETFHCIVEDVDGDMILHHEIFVLKEKDALKEESHYLSFVVSLYEPLPPVYYVRMISDRWLRCEAVLPVSFRHFILPDKFPAQTEKQDLEPLKTDACQWNIAIDFFRSRFEYFNPIQTQVFKSFYESDESVFLGAPTSSGKTACAELAIMRQFRKSTLTDDPNDLSHGKIVYVAPLQSIVDITYDSWKENFQEVIADVEIVKLTGIIANDIKLLELGNIIMATAEQWDVISRRWMKRANVQRVSLFIVDEIHLLSEHKSYMEVVISRMRYMASSIERNIRFIALGSSIANYKVVAEWMGAKDIYNFMPNARPIPLDIFIQSFDHNNQALRLLAMSKPAYQAIKKNFDNKPVMIFVPDRKQARLAALDLISCAASDDNSKIFLGDDEKDILTRSIKVIKEETLKHTLSLGVGFLHEGLSEKEKKIVKGLYTGGMINAIIVSHNLCWEVGNLYCYLVLIMDPVVYDFTQNRYVEYPISEILQMIGRASRPDVDTLSKCVFFCHTPKKNYFVKFISEPLPIESNLEMYLHDAINAEVSVENIETSQDVIDWITWSYMYRRLVQNPNYYNLSGKTGQHINDHLSELIEKTIDDLTKSKCIEVDDDDNITSGNLGKIAAYYNIRHTTIQVFDDYLNENRKMKHLLEIISAAEEFENLPIRDSDEGQLQAIVDYLEYKVDPVEGIYCVPNVKTNILLQCHFLRRPLSIDLSLDQKEILETSLKLVHAMVDIISTSEWLTPALLAMELSQMIVQACLVNQSSLFQLPYFDHDLVEKCKENGINDIGELLEMDDEPRERLLGFSQKQLEEVAQVCNRIPNYTIRVTVPEENQEGATVGETIALTIDIEGDEEDEEDQDADKLVYAPFYPKEKQEQWWLIIADEREKRLLSIKRITAKSGMSVKIPFTPSETGNKKFTAMLVCDSYIGCDVTDNFNLMIYDQ